MESLLCAGHHAGHHTAPLLALLFVVVLFHSVGLCCFRRGCVGVDYFGGLFTSKTRSGYAAQAILELEVQYEDLNPPWQAPTLCF